MLDERGVMESILAGDKERFADLVRAYQAKVLSLCVSLLRDRAEADDAAQEIFLKAYRGLSGFRRDSSFSTWIYRVAYRHCLDVLRSRKLRRAEPLEALPERADPASSAGEARVEVESVLSRLSPEYRLVLTLREVQGLTYEEIAACTGVSLDSVKARLRRAREALQEEARHFLSRSDV
jgi:RNA polymerase sigma-70 factor, ECF subfamily